MNKFKQFDILAPGIYSTVCSDLNSGLELIFKYVEENKISWIQQENEPWHMTFYPDGEKHYKEIYDYFDKKFQEIESDYFLDFHTPRKIISYKRHYVWIAKYSNDNHMFRHFDDQDDEKPYRSSTLYYPNDDYEGGEIEFPRFNLSIKPKKDEVIVFPASYAYDHLVLPITNGTRYLIGTVQG